MYDITLFYGKTIELTAVDPEKDAAEMAGWLQQPDFYHRVMQNHYHPVTEEEVKKRLNELIKRADEKRDCFFYMLRLRENQRKIGFAQLPMIFWAHQYGQIFINFAQPEDLQSYGDEALELILQYGFLEANLFRLSTPLAAYDKETIALYERHGFIREVVRREAVFHEGCYYDELEYGLLLDEYLKNKEVSR